MKKMKVISEANLIVIAKIYLEFEGSEQRYKSHTTHSWEKVKNFFDKSSEI